MKNKIVYIQEENSCCYGHRGETKCCLKNNSCWTAKGKKFTKEINGRDVNESKLVMG